MHWESIIFTIHVQNTLSRCVIHSRGARCPCLSRQGEYQDDLPHGHGIYLFSSGQMYEGEWALGKKHGWSIYTVDNGESAMCFLVGPQLCQ